MSADRGDTWKDISSNIPDSPVNALAEDKYNKNLLFAGTDNGLYVSLDGGTGWEVFQSGIPNVAVHDLVLQDDARHLLAGTHGRSIYQADIAILQQMKENVLQSELFVFNLPDILHSTKWGNPSNAWIQPDTPGLDITFFSGQNTSYTAKVMTADGVVVSSATLDAVRGLNILSYDLAFSKKGKSDYLKKYKRELQQAKNGKTYLPTGNYVVEIIGDGLTEKTSFTINDKDPDTKE